jgi:NADPH:quinone reductase-like Zn-dependent oxidoreductase
MKAVVYDRYGPPDVLRMADVERPVPKPDEVLVRVRATTVNRTDTGIRQGAPLISRLISGPLRPRWRILGSELAGVVEATGAAVTEFKAGDAVFGVNAWRLGAHAEFVSVPESGALALKPAGMSFEEAAAVCDGAILALNCLRLADLRAGKSILVYGASGSIGTAGVQLSRYFDADVTGVASTKNVGIVRSLGAGGVIDYTREDFTTNGQAYDVIFDAVGKLSFGACRSSLKPGGIYLPTDHLVNVILALWTSRVGDKKVGFAIPPRYTKKDVVFLKGLLEEGKYRAVIDRCYPLEDVIQATRYVETQQKTGNVVLTVDSLSPPPLAGCLAGFRPDDADQRGDVVTPERILVPRQLTGIDAVGVAGTWLPGERRPCPLQ